MVTGKRSVWIFVEGGGNDNPALKTECRHAFHVLLERAGFQGRLPKVIPCGSRRNAFEQFELASRRTRPGEPRPLLLVDSEDLVTDTSPWEHVRRRQGDGWTCPPDADDDDLHFMVVCMETWLVADRSALGEYYGADLHKNSLPTRLDLEALSKADLNQSLSSATRTCTKGPYGKSHSFKLLALVNPKALQGTWARRFFSELERRL